MKLLPTSLLVTLQPADALLGRDVSGRGVVELLDRVAVVARLSAASCI